MTRDVDRVRQVLLTVEATPNAATTTGEDATYATLLVEAGYLAGSDTSIMSERRFKVTGITWRGYELLELIRPEPKWRALRDAMPDAPFEVLATLAYELAMKRVKEIVTTQA